MWEFPSLHPDLLPKFSRVDQAPSQPLTEVQTDPGISLYWQRPLLFRLLFYFSALYLPHKATQLNDEIIALDYRRLLF